jgi:hypothetical protein
MLTYRYSAVTQLRSEPQLEVLRPKADLQLESWLLVGIRSLPIFELVLLHISVSHSRTPRSDPRLLPHLDSER